MKQLPLFLFFNMSMLNIHGLTWYQGVTFYPQGVYGVRFLKNYFFHQSLTFDVHYVLVVNVVFVPDLLMCCFTRNRNPCHKLYLEWKKVFCSGLVYDIKPMIKNTFLHLNIFTSICSTIDILSVLIFKVCP